MTLDFKKSTALRLTGKRLNRHCYIFTEFDYNIFSKLRITVYKHNNNNCLHCKKF